MRPIIAHVKTWIPSFLAVSAVVAASWYAVVRKADASAGVYEMRRMAEIFDVTADSVRSNVWSSDAIADLKERNAELTRRIDDSYKQGLVVPQLSELARQGAMPVLEIQPVKSRKSDVTNTEFPRYRVMVRGSYQAIAEYMQRCGDLRIPIRIVQGRIAHEMDEKGRPMNILVADLTVEAFQPEQTTSAREQEAG